ncbi:hypothetical protein B0T18DRAFT_464677 [Schizothecium vesticola]|uniref:Rhodopsin domain-containing protein n=1 Tax=Schizothecium vesticola TaxID=314040 RepID=A0AA40EV13_9PEZI|nr:hypothetical protein B0T18DRAFT_464677 [Schizothecium vesticola]
MSNSGAWGPTPPGVDLSENQNMGIVGSVVAIMAIGLSSVVLRMFTRSMKTGPGLAADDYAILFAAAMGIGTAVCCLISVQWGGGKHLWVVTHSEFTKLYQTTYAFVIIYITCISATKISILLFYRRIFGTNIVWALVLGLTIAHWAEVTITWLAGCRPIDYYWRQYTDPTATGSCIDAPLFYFCNGIIGLIIDVAILLVPTPTSDLASQPAHHQEDLRRRHIAPGRVKNASVCVASAIRIVMMDQLVKSPDFTWAMSKVFIWSCCEPFVGIVCACLPTYAPLVRQLWRRAGISSTPGLSSMMLSSTRGAPRDKKAGHRDPENQSFSGTRTAAEDEIELTADIISQKQPPPSSSSSATGKTATGGLDALPQAGLNGVLIGDGAGAGRGEIMVRKDFSWEISSGTS